MGQYKAISAKFRNFNLILDDQKIGELVYSDWFSPYAEIILDTGAKYQLVSKGFWQPSIELYGDDPEKVLEFKIGSKGITIKTYFDHQEQTYLLKTNGLFIGRFILLDENNKKLMIAETFSKWNKFNVDYHIETIENFENHQAKELLLLTVLHSIAYYRTMVSAG